MSYKRHRSRKPLSLDDARLRMTDAIKQAERIIMDGDNDSQKINAINALSGLISRYARLTETVELERRIEKLEERQKLRSVS